MTWHYDMTLRYSKLNPKMLFQLTLLKPELPPLTPLFDKTKKGFY